MKKTRRNHAPVFKVKMALATIRGDKIQDELYYEDLPALQKAA